MLKSEPGPVSDTIILEAKGIAKKYHSTGFHFEMDHLEMRQGEITGLVGGKMRQVKTTFLRILAGDFKT